MPCLENEEIVPLDLDTLPDDVLEYARSRVGETAETKTMAIDELREMVYHEGEVTPVRMDDDFLIRFLRARNYKIEAAYRLLVNYCQFREENMSYYEGVNPLDMVHIGDSNILSVLPYRDQHGRRILVFKIGNWIPSECPLEDIFKATVGVLEAGLLEQRAQILGGIAIFDMEGLSLQHALYFTPAVVSKTLQIMMTSFPMKIASIHIVNESWIFERIFALFKPFLGNKYEETVHFHGTDMVSLQKYINPDNLPKMYGGTRPDCSYIQWFLSLSKDERIVKAFDELGYDLHFEGKLEERIREKIEKLNQTS